MAKSIMSKISSRRGRTNSKPVHEEVDIELDLNDFEDTIPLPTTDDEEFEYFVNDEEFIFTGGGFDPD